MILTEILNRLCIYIYCLNPDTLVGFCACFGLISNALHRKFSGRPWWRAAVWMLLGIWTAGILWITLFSRSIGSGGGSQWFPLHTYWAVLTGADTELLRSALMNAFLFFPAGLLCACLPRRERKVGRRMVTVCVVFGLLSLSIELTQYVLRVGQLEADDLLHNVLGAAAGYLAFNIDAGDL